MSGIMSGVTTSDERRNKKCKIWDILLLYYTVYFNREKNTFKEEPRCLSVFYVEISNEKKNLNNSAVELEPVWRKYKIKEITCMSMGSNSMNKNLLKSDL